MPRKPDIAIPFPVKNALQKLGADIRHARRRRRIPTKIMAERAAISRMTLSKVEKGDPSVTFGTYATVLFTLGLIDKVYHLADLKEDSIGLFLADEDLPQRIHLPRHQKTKDQT